MKESCELNLELPKHKFLSLAPHGYGIRHVQGGGKIQTLLQNTIDTNLASEVNWALNLAGKELLKFRKKKPDQ